MTLVRFFRADGTLDKEVEAEPGQRLLDVAWAAREPLEGACEGVMACSTCHVIVDTDDFGRFRRRPRRKRICSISRRMRRERRASPARSSSPPTCPSLSVNPARRDQLDGAPGLVSGRKWNADAIVGRIIAALGVVCRLRTGRA